MEAQKQDLVSFTRQYEATLPLYQRLVEEVQHALQVAAKKEHIAVTYSGRAKAVDSFVSKIERKLYGDPLRQMTDLAGVRAVCAYEADSLRVGEMIEASFDVREVVDKSENLGVDKMGYNGAHYVIRLGERFSGARYDDIKHLTCEIQVRTILQDAWATISRQLIYTDEDSIPKLLQRDLNNVASLLEIAQNVFDAVRGKRVAYIREIRKKEETPSDFLSQPVDFDTLMAFSRWKFPALPPSEQLTLALLSDLDSGKYSSLYSINASVEKAKLAVEAYRAERPTLFTSATDFITKSLGFTDPDFRDEHHFSLPTRQAFEKYADLVGAVEAARFRG